jgi:preprotein translocase subunit SecA
MNTATLHLPVPGMRWGSYPERPEPPGGRSWRRGLPLPFTLGWPGAWRRQAQAAWDQAAQWQALGEQAFAALRDSVQQQLLQGGLDGAAAAQALAYVAEAARRTQGRQAYVTQLMAALALLRGHLAEMATGEGKSLAAALTAGVAALAGIPVHVLTANDYLVQRDAETFTPLYRLLHQRCAWVGARHDEDERRHAYAADVVYVTAREAAFDYLRDRMRHGTGSAPLQQRARALAGQGGDGPVLRGLCMAVIDEADSILIDEAQMPLVLSREVADPAARAFLWQAWALSGRLVLGHDFVLQGQPARAVLRPEGLERLARLAASLGPLWVNAQHRAETVVTALSARHLLQRDRDYVVVPGDPAQRKKPEIAIVDMLSGRIADGRRWSRGLHGLVALKEGIPMPPESETMLQMTYQRFFRRYHRLCGMSGTLAEGRTELRQLYGCTMLRVPLRLPDRASAWPLRCYADEASRQQAAVARIQAVAATGRPVLVGCDSVAASEAMGAALAAAGVAHQVLHARLDAAEAAIVARAGVHGQVTVATNMAGRGTDIHLDALALAAGGLHVLSCQHNASRRHDRQLSGRAARQGQPGSHETWLVPQPPLADATEQAGGAGARLSDLYRLLQRLPGRVRADGRAALPQPLLAWALRREQQRTERLQARRRQQLFQHDIRFDASLCFTGQRR